MCLALIFAACSTKTVEEQQKDLLVQLITNGQWAVTTYTKGTVDRTADFSGYKFQFKDNNTVDAIKNGAVEKTGSWVGNATTRTIQSEFTNAAPALMLLNGTWYVDDSGLTYVKASQTVSGEPRILRLDKQ
jgi:hypothetical protein